MLDQRLTQGDERNDFRDMDNMDMGAGKLIEA
jgi:hypothetical protein